MYFLLPPVFAIHHYLCRTHDHVSRFRIEKGGSTFMRDNVPLIFVFFILFIPTRGLCFFGFLRANLIIGNIEQAPCTDRCCWSVVYGLCWCAFLGARPLCGNERSDRHPTGQLIPSGWWGCSRWWVGVDLVAPKFAVPKWMVVCFLGCGCERGVGCFRWEGGSLWGSRPLVGDARKCQKLISKCMINGILPAETISWPMVCVALGAVCSVSIVKILTIFDVCFRMVTF